jgi:hypothetical protein
MGRMLTGDGLDESWAIARYSCGGEWPAAQRPRLKTNKLSLFLRSTGQAKRRQYAQSE